MAAGEWRHARRRSADRGRHPGAGDIAGEVVRRAAGDGRDRMLVKTTAPRAQPRRAGWRPTRRLAGRHREPSPEDLAAARSAWLGAGAGRGSTSSPAAGTAVPWGLAPRHPPAGLPASGCRDGMRLARGQPPPGLYERLARRASGAYDSLATVCVTPAGLLASDNRCFSSALTVRIGIRSAAQAQRPGGRPRDPADPRRCRRYRAQGLQWSGPDRHRLLVDRRRQADPSDLRPLGSVPSGRIGSARRRVRAAALGARRGRE